MRSPVTRVQIVPAGFHLIQLGHVGHGTACAHIRQDDFLMRPAEDIRALGHEVHAAKDDVLGVLPIAGPLGQLEGVSADVGKLDDLVALVVMPENDETLAEASLELANPLVGLAVGQTGEVLRKNRLQHG